MSLKGFRRQTIGIPSLGKLRIGKLVEKNGVFYPKGLDEFVAPAEYEQTFKEIYGKGESQKVTEIDIFFPSDDMSVNFPIWLKKYNSKHELLCKGCNANVYKEFSEITEDDYGQIVSGKEPQFEDMICRGKACPMFNPELQKVPAKDQKQKCKIIGTIIFFVKGVENLGVFRIDTGSYHSYNNIMDYIEGIVYPLTEKLMGQKRIMGIPLKLKVKIEEKGEKSHKVPILSLSLPYSIEKITAIMQDETKALGFEKQKKALPPVAITEQDIDNFDDATALIYSIDGIEKSNIEKVEETFKAEPEPKLTEQDKKGLEKLEKEKPRLKQECIDMCNELGLTQFEIESKVALFDNVWDLHAHLTELCKNKKDNENKNLQGELL